MTAIVGLVYNNEMHLAGDGVVSDERGRVLPVGHPKVFRRKNYLMGFSGDSVACDIVEAARLPDYTDPDVDPFRWCICDLVPMMRQSFKEAGYEGETLAALDFSALFMIRGEMFELDEKFAVAGPLLCSYHAIGSGCDFCIGVMAATQKYSVRYRLKTALEVASLNCSNVGPPFTFLKMGF